MLLQLLDAGADLLSVHVARHCPDATLVALAGVCRRLHRSLDDTLARCMVASLGLDPDHRFSLSRRAAGTVMCIYHGDTSAAPRAAKPWTAGMPARQQRQVLDSPQVVMATASDRLEGSVCSLTMVDVGDDGASESSSGGSDMDSWVDCGSDLDLDGNRALESSAFILATDDGECSENETSTDDADGGAPALPTGVLSLQQLLRASRRATVHLLSSRECADDADHTAQPRRGMQQLARRLRHGDVVVAHTEHPDRGHSTQVWAVVREAFPGELELCSSGAVPATPCEPQPAELHDRRTAFEAQVRAALASTQPMPRALVQQLRSLRLLCKPALPLDADRFVLPADCSRLIAEHGLAAFERYYSCTLPAAQAPAAEGAAPCAGPRLWTGLLCGVVLDPTLQWNEHVSGLASPQLVADGPERRAVLLTRRDDAADRVAALGLLPVFRMDGDGAVRAQGKRKGKGKRRGRQERRKYDVRF